MKQDGITFLSHFYYGDINFALPDELAALFTPATLGCASKFATADFDEFKRMHAPKLSQFPVGNFGFSNYIDFLEYLKHKTGVNLMNYNNRCDVYQGDRTQRGSRKAPANTEEPISNSDRIAELSNSFVENILPKSEIHFYYDQLDPLIASLPIATQEILLTQWNAINSPLAEDDLANQMTQQLRDAGVLATILRVRRDDGTDPQWLVIMDPVQTQE